MLCSMTTPYREHTHIKHLHPASLRRDSPLLQSNINNTGEAPLHLLLLKIVLLFLFEYFICPFYLSVYFSFLFSLFIVFK